MEQVNEAQPQSQPPSQRFYALEQLGELAGTITLISEGLQAYRAQVAGLLAGQKKAEAFELYRLLERQRTYLVEQIRATRPFLMELENPLAPAAQKLAEQLAAFPLMTADYSKLTEVLKRFADALPDHQTTDASIIGRLMNNVRLGHYPTDLTHVGYIANSIVFPAENTANLIDPCCGTGTPAPGSPWGRTANATALNWMTTGRNRHSSSCTVSASAASSAPISAQELFMPFS